jgi:hypothetical protein
MIYRFRKEMLEDAKGMTRNHKSKNRQNDKKKKPKRLPIKLGMNSGVPEG